MAISPRIAPLPIIRPQTVAADTKRQNAHQNIKQQGIRQQAERQEQGAVQGIGEDGAAQEDLSPAAQLQNFIDASDNMSMVMGQFRSRRDFDKKADQSSDSFERVLDEDAHPKAQQIMKIAKSLGISGDELLRQMRGLFPDASDLVIILRELLRRRQLDALVRVRLQKALAQAESEAPPRAMKAGINIALKARLFGAKLALRASLLRASYRMFLESEDPEVLIYEEWIASYGHERRALVTEFLESALVADMLAQDPSCSRIEFGNLLGKLNQLKLLRSSEGTFIDSMLNDADVAAHNPSEADWLVFMLSLMQAPEEVDALLMDTVGEHVLLSSHAERSRLLHAISRACKALPLNFFIDQEAVVFLWERFEELATVTYRHELMEMRRGVAPVDPFDRDGRDNDDRNDGDNDGGNDDDNNNDREEP